MPTLALVTAIAACGVLSAAVAWLFASRRRIAAEKELFAGFMEHGPFAAFMKDADGRYIYENRAIVDLVGRIRPGVTSLIGKTDAEAFESPEGGEYAANDWKVIAYGKPMRFDETSVEADGTVRNWSSIKFPRTDELGRPCIAGISIDMTALRQALTDVRTSEDRCELALEAGHMGSFTLDLAAQTLDTSPLFAMLHGRPESKTRLTLEESLAEVHPDDRQAIVEAVEAALRDQAPSRITYRVILPDGGIRWVELVGRVTVNAAGRPTEVRGVGFDVTEQRSAYEELARREDVLRRLIDVQENERQTLCHDLHDGMIQYAIGAKMLLESIINVAGAPEQGERIDMALDDDLDDGPANLQTTIYRVVQESLTNVRKHAQTDRATVEIRRTPIEVLVRVTDRGSGYDVAEGRRKGFGLIGMTERVRLIGGTCTIESRRGSGSRVEARLPLAAADTAGGGPSSDFELARS